MVYELMFVDSYKFFGEDCKNIDKTASNLSENMKNIKNSRNIPPSDSQHRLMGWSNLYEQLCRRFWLSSVCAVYPFFGVF